MAAVNWSLASTLVTALTSAVISGVLLALVLQMKRVDRQRAMHNEHLTPDQLARLGEIRRDLEYQMYGLNDRLTSNRDRYLDVNHLVLEALRGREVPPSSRGSESFLRSVGVSSDDLRSPDNSLVAVVMPFHERFIPVFSAIRKAAESVGMKAERGDERSATGAILRQVLSLIVRSRVVVAVIDGRNPNVFYELGIAQALGKPVIVISSEIDEVPFDLSGQRLVLFSTPEQLERVLPSEFGRSLL